MRVPGIIYADESLIRDMDEKVYEQTTNVATLPGIVVASFAVDLVFLGGVTGDEGQKAAGVVVILLLWRIARVVDGKLTN